MKKQTSPLDRTPRPLNAPKMAISRQGERIKITPDGGNPVWFTLEEAHKLGEQLKDLAGFGPKGEDHIEDMKRSFLGSFDK